jgi:GR25 family glycosyltransferase involved in LPS biosynthesis
MDLLKHTFFINLEKRTDRLEHVTKQLASIGLVGERFNAVKTAVGAIGCTLSHIRCLELAKQREYEQVFICEDDITFLDPDTFKSSLELFANNRELEWDVLIIGGNIVPPYESISDYCVRVGECQTTTGYVVKRHYYDVLIDNFRDSVKNLVRYPDNKKEYALDIYWKRLQKSGRWYMIFPLTVVQYDTYSDIEERYTDYRGLMLDKDKTWLCR